MDSQNLKMIVAAWAFFSLSAMPAIAHEGKGPHDETQEAKQLQKSGDVSDLLKEIKEHEGHLQMLIQNGQLDQVHEAAFTIRDLSKSLAEKSAGLAHVDMDKVKVSVQEVEKIADLLDQYGDVRDVVKTGEQFQRLKTALQEMEKQYLADVASKNE